MITFDPVKRETTLRERGIDFAVDAAKVFAGKVVTTEDDRFDYGERAIRHMAGCSAVSFSSSGRHAVRRGTLSQ